jgi:hypothetical protein
MNMNMKGIFKTPLILFCLMIGWSAPSWSFIEQEMSFQEKYQTVLGLFSASGRFQETYEESEMDTSGMGFFGEIQVRRTPWSLRLDTWSFNRDTGGEGLSVNNTYREFRAWGLGSWDLNETVFLYGGLGTGLLFPETSIEVLGDARSLKGKSNTLGGYMLGLRLVTAMGLVFDLWSQTVYAPIYPNSNVSTFALALGYQF